MQNSSDKPTPSNEEWVLCWSCGQKLCKCIDGSKYQVKVNKGKRFSFEITIYAGSIRCNRCREVTQIPLVRRNAKVTEAREARRQEA